MWPCGHIYFLYLSAVRAFRSSADCHITTDARRWIYSPSPEDFCMRLFVFKARSIAPSSSSTVVG